MNTIVLLVTEVLLILFAILLHVIWGIFPQLGPIAFFILLSITLLLMLGVFVWYLLIYRSDDPEKMINSGDGGSVRDSNAPSRRGSATSSTPSLPVSSVQAQVSDGSVQAQVAPTETSSNSNFVNGTLNEGVSVFPIRRSPKLIINGYNSNLKSTETQTGEFPSKVLLPVEAITLDNFYIYHGKHKLASTFFEIFPLTGYNRKTIIELDEKNPKIFTSIWNKIFVREKNKSLSDITKNDNDKTPIDLEHLLVLFIGINHLNESCIVYISSKNSFILFPGDIDNIRFVNRNYMSDNDLDLIKCMLNNPGLKLFMTSENKLGLLKFDYINAPEKIILTDAQKKEENDRKRENERIIAKANAQAIAIKLIKESSDAYTAAKNAANEERKAKEKKRMLDEELKQAVNDLNNATTLRNQIDNEAKKLKTEAREAIKEAGGSDALNDQKAKEEAENLFKSNSAQGGDCLNVAPKPAGKPGAKPAGKPGAKVAPKPGAKPAGKPGAKVAPKPAGKQGGKSAIADPAADPAVQV